MLQGEFAEFCRKSMLELLGTSDLTLPLYLMT